MGRACRYRCLWCAAAWRGPRHEGRGGGERKTVSDSIAQYKRAGYAWSSEGSREWDGAVLPEGGRRDTNAGHQAGHQECGTKAATLRSRRNGMQAFRDLLVGFGVGLGWSEAEIVGVGWGLGAAGHLIAQQYPGKVNANDQGNAEE